MPFKSIKDKIENFAGDEILGETLADKEKRERERRNSRDKPRVSSREEKKPSNSKIEENQPKEKVGKKVNPENKETKQKAHKRSIFKFERKPKEKKAKEDKVLPKRSNLIEQTESVSKSTGEHSNQDNKKAAKTAPLSLQTMHNLVEGYQDVLEILNIKEISDLKLDFESKDLDYIEFTQTTPVGFDFEEVADFIAKMKYVLSRMETALNKRDQEVIILASEVKKVEKRMIEQNQEKEMKKMIGGMTEEEMLIEENLDLRVKINQLEESLRTGAGSGEVERLKRENKALREENKMLMLAQVSTENTQNTTSSLPKVSNELPKMKPTQSPKSSIPPMPVFSEEPHKTKKEPVSINKNNHSNSLPSMPSMPVFPKEKMEGDIQKNNNNHGLDSLLKMGQKKDDSIEKMINNMEGE